MLVNVKKFDTIYWQQQAFAKNSKHWKEMYYLK